tara:strand:- start:1071 stop:1175 length:105 start_codon:yes stop_codon:yes gene_type:complete
LIHTLYVIIIEKIIATFLISLGGAKIAEKKTLKT